MKIFGSRNKHPHADLPAYADGELSPSKGERVERHLADCAACREELADLRTLSATLRGLPEAAPPRSFALTSAQVARPVPVAGRSLPAWAAMRIAGTGVAAVFAVVVMLDAGGIIEDGGSNESALTTQYAGGDLNQDSLESTVLESPGANLEIEGAADRGVTATDAAAPAAGEGGIGASAPDGDGDDSAAPPADPDDAAPDGGYRVEATPLLTDMAASGEDSDGEEYRDTSANVVTDGDGDGTNTLLLIEIALGALAALAIGGSFMISRARQRI